MSSPAHTGWFSAGTLLSCVTLLLFCAGFLRVELKMKEQETRMDALEVKLSSQSAQQHSIVFGEWLNLTTLFSVVKAIGNPVTVTAFTCV